MMSGLVDAPTISSPQPSIDARSPYDVAVISIVTIHLLFTATATAFVLHFHLRTLVGLPSSTSIRRRLRLLLRLNSLWPIRLLLLTFASLLSLSELLRLPLRHPRLCDAYALSSQSFAEPAFFSTLLFLLRLSSSDRKPSPPLSFLSASASALLSSSPFLLLHSLFLFLLPPNLLPSSQTYSPLSGRCTHPLYGSLLLALFGSIYIPLFVSAICTSVNVVINKKLRVRLYLLASVVVASLSTQVASLAAASLWPPGCSVSQGLAVLSFASLLACVAVGEVILVVQPVVDALAIVVHDDGKHDVDVGCLDLEQV